MSTSDEGHLTVDGREFQSLYAQETSNEYLKVAPCVDSRLGAGNKHEGVLEEKGRGPRCFLYKWVLLKKERKEIAN